MPAGTAGVPPAGAKAPPKFWKSTKARATIPDVETELTVNVAVLPAVGNTTVLAFVGKVA